MYRSARNDKAFIQIPCGQLLDRRETLRISYITLNDYLMEGFAPILERLSGG